MPNKRFLASTCFLSLIVGLLPAVAGDVFAGKATEVRSGELVVVDYGKGQYVVRLAGVSVPQDTQISAKAKQFLTDKALGQIVRARFQGRSKNGEMVSRLFVGDPGEDLGLELVRAGLARRRAGIDAEIGYKYGELAGAEKEAREGKRGLWATVHP